ncbi:MAG: KOW domain-containing RNA-binding protein [Oscillospiraceae bacterium]
MNIEIGSAALSKSGRDKGRFFAVLSIEDGFAFVADGDLRKLCKPKRKNLKHLGATAHVFALEEMTSDKALYTAIKARYCGGKPSKEG